MTGYTASSTQTRPGNTTPYLANDVQGATVAAMTFANIGPSGGEILLMSASLEIDSSTAPVGMTTFTLHLYTVTPPSAAADNDVWDLPSGDRASYVGSVVLGTIIDMGSTLYLGADAINKPIKLAGTDLFGYLVTNGSYTPVSATVQKVVLHSIKV